MSRVLALVSSRLLCRIDNKVWFEKDLVVYCTQQQQLLLIVSTRGILNTRFYLIFFYFPRVLGRVSLAEEVHCEMVGYHQSAQAQHFQHELDDDDEEFYHRHQQHQLQQQQQQQQRLQQRYNNFILFFEITCHRCISMLRISPQRSRAHYNRLQYRRMYRYGLSLLLVGALCNWIGFAQHYFAPVRYLVRHHYYCISIDLCVATSQTRAVSDTLFEATK